MSVGAPAIAASTRSQWVIGFMPPIVDDGASSGNARRARTCGAGDSMGSRDDAGVNPSRRLRSAR